MILKKLSIENLRSYEKQEINFPLGSTLLSGDIGTGKTTVLLAIEFALFGLQPSQRGASLLRNGADEGSVTLEFVVEEKNVIITRTLKRSKKSITQDSATIKIDREIFEGSVTEVKSKILQLLNYPPEFAKKTNLLYRFTVYTPQEEMKQIILEPGDIRLNTLRHVFGIDKYKKIEENISPLTAKLRENIRTNEGILYDLENNKNQLKQREQDLVNLREEKKRIEQEYEKLIILREKKEYEVKEVQKKIDEKKELVNENSKSNILISEKEQQRTNIKKNIQDLRYKIEEAKKISFNKEDYLSLEKRIRFQEEKEEELQKEYIQIIGNINSLENRKKESEKLKDKISAMQKCPTCLQEVPPEYRRNITDKTTEEIQSAKEELETLSKRKNQIIQETENIKRAKQEFKKSKEKMDILKIKFETVKEKEQMLEEENKKELSMMKDIELLEKHIKIIEKSIEDYKKYDSEYDQKIKESNDAKKNENNCAIKKAETNKEIQFSEKQIEEIKEEIERKGKLKEQTENLKELEYWISKKFLSFILFTEKQVMITLKEEFSNLFSKWFSILVSDTLSAKLDDDFSPIIEQQDYELDYQFLSGGERTAIALAYRLSLNQVINSLLSNIKTKDLVILDEPTDGFSSQQLNKMRDVLNQLNVKQLILVSHEQRIESFVDNIIKFKKEGRFTQVE
jgi:DNA repair protein SbcC/Rad50